jgi:hypothetical protein
MRRLIGRGWAGASALFSLCVVANHALSQGMGIDPLSLQAGARARILGPTTDSQYTLIKVASATPDSLHYRLDHVFETRGVAWRQISKMEVSSGSHSNFLRGVGLGLLVGIVAGAALGAASADGVDGYTPGATAALFAIPVGMLGAVAGAVLGLVARTEDWIPVAVPGARGAAHRE